MALWVNDCVNVFCGRVPVCRTEPVGGVYAPRDVRRTHFNQPHAHLAQTHTHKHRNPPQAIAARNFFPADLQKSEAYRKACAHVLCAASLCMCVCVHENRKQAFACMRVQTGRYTNTGLTVSRSRSRTWPRRPRIAHSPCT